MNDELNDDNINYAIFISQIMSCMNCARILKIIIPDGNPVNQTYREIGNSLQQSILLNASKIWDDNSYNLKNLLLDFSDGDSREVGLREYDALRLRHSTIIGKIKPWRNKIIAHFDKTDMKKFSNMAGEISEIQEMVREVSELISNRIAQPVKIRFIDYDDIEYTLGLELQS